MAETFYFEIIASDKKFYSGACEHVIFPAVDGLYGVLANHEDTVTAVVAGELRFKVDGEWKVCVVGEGFADVTRDFVVIVVDTVERPEDIDIIRAREAKTRAEERLKQKQSRLLSEFCYGKQLFFFWLHLLQCFQNSSQTVCQHRRM